MKTRNHFLPAHRAGLVAATLLSAAAIAAPALSAGLEATWLRPKTGKHVRSYSCGGGLGLKVVDSGKVIMCGAKSEGGGTYRGTLTSTEDGKEYAGTATISGDSLVLSGCVLAGLICKNETWSKVK